MKHTPSIPALSDATDVELITAVASERSAAALEEIYRRYQPMLRSVIMRVVNNHAEADEVLQDVFVQVWELASSYSPEKGHFLGWLVTLARRRSVDHIRRICAYQNATGRYEESVKPAAPHVNEMFIVDREVCQHELQQQVATLLQKLPEEQREAVNLTFFKGMSQREIASHLSVPLGTIKTRIELGMRKLGRSLLTQEAA
jgi:RNA polymerase sigma-70 factor, ECF subfamily